MVFGLSRILGLKKKESKRGWVHGFAKKPPWNLKGAGWDPPKKTHSTTPGWGAGLVFKPPAPAHPGAGGGVMGGGGPSPGPVPGV